MNLNRSFILFAFCALIASLIFSAAPFVVNSQDKSEDGMFIHISHGKDDPHRLLMALNMAAIMSEDRNVLVYCDIKAIEALLAESPDIAYSHFPSSHSQIETLLDRGVTIYACPGCLKAAGKSKDDLMEGIQIADKEGFFNFTEGRIITLDY